MKFYIRHRFNVYISNRMIILLDLSNRRHFTNVFADIGSRLVEIVFARKATALYNLNEKQKSKLFQIFNYINKAQARLCYKTKLNTCKCFM